MLSTNVIVVPGLGGGGLRLLQHLGHQVEAGRVREHDVHAEAREERRDALRHRQRPRVRRRVRPRHRDLEAAEVLAAVLAERHQVGERLRRMVDVALKVDERDVRPLRDLAHPEVALVGSEVVADGDALAVARERQRGVLRGSRRARPASCRRRGRSRARRAASCPSRRRCACASTCRGTACRASSRRGAVGATSPPCGRPSARRRRRASRRARRPIQSIVSM